MNEFNVLFQPQMLGKIKLKNRINHWIICTTSAFCLTQHFSNCFCQVALNYGLIHKGFNTYF